MCTRRRSEKTGNAPQRSAPADDMIAGIVLFIEVVPDVPCRQLPHAPENPAAVLSTSEKRAINLAWAKPFDGNSPLIRYVLEVSENSRSLIIQSRVDALASLSALVTLRSLGGAGLHHLENLWIVYNGGLGLSSGDLQCCLFEFYFLFHRSLYDINVKLQSTHRTQSMINTTQ